MTESTIIHKAYTIHLISYQSAQAQWVPEAWVHLSTEERTQGRPIRNESTAGLLTRDAANAVAKQLAIAWVDSQIPSGAAPPVRLAWTFDKPTRPGWYWYKERGVNLDYPMPAWVFDQPPFVCVLLFAVQERDKYRQVKQVKEYAGEWWGPFGAPK